jgi:hypothetical protein
MLFMHEVHKVRGRAEDAFEAAFRDGRSMLLAYTSPHRSMYSVNLSS